MTFLKDSPLVSRVVPTASSEQGARPGGAADIRGITVHMAEGGGTVSWLTRLDGNSSTYVVEYTGALVQMVQETHWAGSINPDLLRMTNDAAFTYLGSQCIYGRSAAVAALGTTAANDPNRYVIAIEVEGYAATGPNAKQRATLRALVNDIRRRRGPLATLGHRDFQSYKRCPGHLIPWVDYGGHAVKAAYQAAPTPIPVTGGSSVAIQGSTVPETPTRVVLRDDPAKAGRSRWLYVWSDHRPDTGNKQLEPQRPVTLTRFIDGDTYAVAYEPTTADTNETSIEMFVKTVDILRTEPFPVPVCPPTTDCGPLVAQATAPLNDQISALGVQLQLAGDAAIAAREETLIAAQTERERIALAEANRVRGL